MDSLQILLLQEDKMSTMILSDLTKMKTGDLIDAIHDTVCGMEEPTKEEITDLFNLVDELRSRSLVSAVNNQGPKTLNS